jgi:hypothetical protein
MTKKTNIDKKQSKNSAPDKRARIPMKNNEMEMLKTMTGFGFVMR